jgi:hypothetical protein
MIAIATGKPILDLEVSFLILKENYFDLVEKSQPLAQIVQTEEGINQKKTERRALGVACALHNFYASVSMLVDHYRANKKRGIYDETFALAHDEKIKELFHGDAIGSLSSKLRNQFSHVEIPVISLVPDLPRYKALLDIHYLRGALDTNESERKLLATLPDKIPVHELAISYFDKAEKLYQWTQFRYAEINPESSGDLCLLLEPLPDNSSMPNPLHGSA